MAGRDVRSYSPSLWGESTMHKSDKRDGDRVPCEFEARIEPEAGPALRAVVRNISTCGARLEGVDVVAAPEQFDLLITRDTGATERRRARRVWGLDGAMGVNFIDGVGAWGRREISKPGALPSPLAGEDVIA